MHVSTRQGSFLETPACWLRGDPRQDIANPSFSIRCAAYEQLCPPRLGQTSSPGTQQHKPSRLIRFHRLPELHRHHCRRYACKPLNDCIVAYYNCCGVAIARDFSPVSSRRRNRNQMFGDGRDTLRCVGCACAGNVLARVLLELAAPLILLYHQTGVGNQLPHNFRVVLRPVQVVIPASTIKPRDHDEAGTYRQGIRRAVNTTAHSLRLLNVVHFFFPVVYNGSDNSRSMLLAGNLSSPSDCRRLLCRVVIAKHHTCGGLNIRCFFRNSYPSGDKRNTWVRLKSSIMSASPEPPEDQPYG
jgi:hypothetical protein